MFDQIMNKLAPDVLYFSQNLEFNGYSIFLQCLRSKDCIIYIFVLLCMFIYYVHKKSFLQAKFRKEYILKLLFDWNC